MMHTQWTCDTATGFRAKFCRFGSVAVASTSVRRPFAAVQFLELIVQSLLQGCPRRFVDVLHLPRVLQSAAGKS